MKKMPVGFAIMLLIIQIIIYLGDSNCGPNCMINKESLGITIFFNICFVIIGFIISIKNKDN